jgi:hypothetical protein
MRKLRLGLDDLSVVSFEVPTRTAARGTAFGHAETTLPDDTGGTGGTGGDTAAPPCYTCEMSCTRGCDGFE